MYATVLDVERRLDPVHLIELADDNQDGMADAEVVDHRRFVGGRPDPGEHRPAIQEAFFQEAFTGRLVQIAGFFQGVERFHELV